MRRGLSVLALASLLFTMLAYAGPHPAEASDVLEFSEDFQGTEVGQLPQGWTGSTGADAVAVSEDVYGNRYLSSTETVNNVSNTASVSFGPATGIVSADLRVMAMQTNASAWFTLRDSGGAKAVELAYDQSRLARKLPNNTHSFLRTYAANEWYDIHVDIDLANQTYDLAIEGETFLTGEPLMSAVSDIATFSFSTYRYQGGSFRLDDLVILGEDGGEGPGPDPNPAAAYAEDFDAVAPGLLPAGWTGTTGSDRVEVAEEASGNRYLTSTETANSITNMASVNFSPIAGQVTLDLRVLARQTNGTAWFTLRDSSNLKAIELAYDMSRLAYKDAGNAHQFLRNYTAGEWYDIHADIDLAVQTYDIAINGETLAADVPLMNPVQDIAQFGFSTYRYQSGTFQMDDLVIAGLPADNSPPSAGNVSIAGTAAIGEMLTGSYVYEDADADAEGQSVYQWYRGLQANGSDRTAIAEAVTTSYTVTAGDEGHYLFFEVRPRAATGTLQGIAVMSEPMWIPAAEIVDGHAIAVGGSGTFTDSLDQLDRVFSHRGVVLNGGSLQGPGGELTYYSPDVDLGRVALHVTYNKWALNFSLPDELQVVETAYDEETGTFADGNEITLVRMLQPQLMSGVQYVKAVYVSTAIAPGTKQLRIKLPTPGYYSSYAVPGDFKIDSIAFDSVDSTAPKFEGYLIDDMTDFSQYADGVDTANLRAVSLNPATDMSAIRTFGTTSYVKRANANIATTITYAAPEGREFKSAYFEGYYFQSLPANPFELWISADGTDYTRYNTAGIYLHPAFGTSANNSIPDVLQANYLPAGTKYVRLRKPAANIGGFPYLTKLAFAYGDEREPEVIDTDITIHPAGAGITLDGEVELDDNGNPVGEWAGSELIRLSGVTDNNGDRHGADLYMQYDAEKLYVAAIVKDPTPMKNIHTGTGIWNGDALELFIGDEDLDITEFPDKAGTMLPSDRQIVLGSGVDYGYQSYVYTDGVTTFPPIFMEIRKDADGKGYVMEAAIPLESVHLEQPWQGKELLMNAVISDGDYASRGQWGWTTNGEPTKKARGQWGTARFEATPAPAAEMNLSANVDPVSQLVTVSGNTFHVANQSVSLIVRDPSGAISQIDQTKSDANGQFVFSYSLHRDASGNGEYTVWVGGHGVLLPHMTTFTFEYVEAPREPPSQDASLQDLTVANGFLVPEFSADSRVLLALVDRDADDSPLTAYASDSDYAGITLNGQPIQSGEPVPLTYENRVSLSKIVVTAENEITTKTYYLIAVKTQIKKPGVIAEMLMKRALKAYERGNALDIDADRIRSDFDWYFNFK